MNNHDKLVNILRQTYKPRYDLTVFHYGKYYRKNFNVGDSFSRLLLELKKGDVNAIIKVSEIIDGFMPKGAFVAVIPPSKMGRKNHIQDALENIQADKDITLIPIIRTKEIGKKSSNEGSRSYRNELDSIDCRHDDLVKGRDIFLLDDVTTTGCSLKASSDLLMKKGAASVTCIALGKIVSAAEYYNKIIIAMLHITGIGRKSAGNILKLFEEYDIENYETVFEKISFYASTRSAIKLPTFDEFCGHIEKAEKILKEQEKQGIIAINRKDHDNYPEKFKGIGSPPVILFAKGDLSLLHGFRHIAVVGSRKATPHGQKIAYRFGELFGENNVVVSGLAIGCDTFGHKGCIENGGKTVAILPSPITDPEPEENRDLADEIVEKKGLLLSEYYLGQDVQKGYYIARDRLQSALSDSVVVVETEVTGGTMHTVGYCRDQNKLLACYRHPEKYRGMDVIDGNAELINDGALPIGNREDLDIFFRQLEKKRNAIKDSDSFEQLVFAPLGDLTDR